MWLSRSQHQVQVFGASMALVILPVFVQAPLVRYFPWVSLAITPLWLGLGTTLMKRPQWEVWGDLIVGFGWIWLSPNLSPQGFRLGMPITLLCLAYGGGRVGSYFFLGSLLGTAITDLYINWMHLFPIWRQLMQVETDLAPVVLRAAAVALETDMAACRATILALFLLVATAIALFTSRQLAWWAFGGAVFSTLIVDGLFFLSAMLA